MTAQVPGSRGGAEYFTAPSRTVVCRVRSNSFGAFGDDISIKPMLYVFFQRRDRFARAPRAVRCRMSDPDSAAPMARLSASITRESRIRPRSGGADRSKSQDSHSGPTRAVETKIAPFTLSTLAPAVLPWRRLYPGLHRVTWWSIDLRPDADKALDRDRIARTDAGWLVVQQQ